MVHIIRIWSVYGENQEYRHMREKSSCCTYRVLWNTSFKHSYDWLHEPTPHAVIALTDYETSYSNKRSCAAPQYQSLNGLKASGGFRCRSLLCPNSTDVITVAVSKHGKCRKYWKFCQRIYLAGIFTTIPNIFWFMCNIWFFWLIVFLIQN